MTHTSSARNRTHMTREEFETFKRDAEQQRDMFFNTGSLRGYLLEVPLNAIYRDEDTGINLEGSEKEQEDWRIEATLQIEEAIDEVVHSLR